MGGKARLGQWVLLIIIVVMALSELVLAGLSIQAGRFRGDQVVRGILEGWIFWRAWAGAGWSRWLLAGLFLTAAALVVSTGFSSPAMQKRPEMIPLLIGMGAVCLAFGIGLASPWVGAFQAVQRSRAATKPDGGA